MQWRSILNRFPSRTEDHSAQAVDLPTRFIPGVIVCLLFTGFVEFQTARVSQVRQTAMQIQELAFLPPGEFLKPFLLGYNQVAADVVWLRVLQVLGQRTLTPNECEWLYHALDVMTTLDPQYAYAYQVGGVALTELAHRVDLSNALLKKGLKANPADWQIPFYLGYNSLFYLHDYARAADYMALAARLPGRPPYLPGLATRLYAEVGQVEVALDFVVPLWREARDVHTKEALDTRIRELMIERDIRALEQAMTRYRIAEGAVPQNLSALVENAFLQAIPQEPFGGEYRLDQQTGTITSSTHPHRLGLGRWKHQREKADRTQQ
ncbi:tetratricopeptide repeat protein [Nitrospira sp. Nam80]